MPNSQGFAINFQTNLDTNSKISTLEVEIKIRKRGKFRDCTSNIFLWGTVWSWKMFVITPSYGSSHLTKLHLSDRNNSS